MRTPSLKKQIGALLAHWRPVLGLESWAIEIRWDQGDAMGWCIAKPNYQEALIGFNLKRIRKECRLPEHLEDLVVHELVHAVVWKASERSVSQLTRAILRAAGRSYG